MINAYIHVSKEEDQVTIMNIKTDKDTLIYLLELLLQQTTVVYVVIKDKRTSRFPSIGEIKQLL